MAFSTTPGGDTPNLGKPQSLSHKWTEPIIVVTIMIASLIINRRRGVSLFRRSRFRTKSIQDSMEDSEAQRPLHGGDDYQSDDYSPTVDWDAANTPTNPSRFASHFHSKVLEKYPFLVEMFYWALNFVAYSCTKALAATLFAGNAGVTQLAQDHGIAVLDFEHKSMFRAFFPIEEAEFQSFFLNGHQVALTFLNQIYSLVHIPGTVAFLSWYYYAAPNHATFAVARRTMALGNCAAFIIFCFYPCMPPRLLPASFGFHDTVRQENAESVWVDGKHVNQLAAMPSLHFTYAFIIGSTFTFHSGILPIGGRKSFRPTMTKLVFLLMGILYPALVLTVIVATANHYWLDAVAAFFVVIIAFMSNRIWLLLLPAERLLLRVLRLEKPEPTTGDRLSR